MANSNHYTLLKMFLKKGYRLTLSTSTGASVSTINKVIRGEMADNYGIIVALYKLANQVQQRQVQDANKLAFLKKKIYKTSFV